MSQTPPPRHRMRQPAILWIGLIAIGCTATTSQQIDNCDHQAMAVFGPEYVEFDTEAEMRDQLAGRMFFPDPDALPEGATYTQGYYNASDKYDFMQSTISLNFVSVKEEKRRHVEIIYFNEIQPSPDPPLQEHETLEIRGKNAYLFQLPFDESGETLSLTTREGCRILTVTGDFEREALMSIATSLSLDPTR